jgi:hypothetical protein
MFTSQQKPISTNPFTAIAVSPQNETDVYNYVSTQLNAIKALKSFTSLTEINVNELITINNMICDCIEKLSDLPSMYMKKINDNTTCASNIEKYKTLSTIHDIIVEKLIAFTDISNEYSTNLKCISTLNIGAEQAKFTFEEIFCRYKLKLTSVMMDIKKVNSIISLLVK